MEKPLYDFVMDCFAESEQTYQQIADGSGVPRRTVEKVARKETGDPSISTVQQLADYFRRAKRKAAA